MYLAQPEGVRWQTEGGPEQLAVSQDPGGVITDVITQIEPGMDPHAHPAPAGRRYRSHPGWRGPVRHQPFQVGKITAGSDLRHGVDGEPLLVNVRW